MDLPAQLAPEELRWLRHLSLNAQARGVEAEEARLKTQRAQLTLSQYLLSLERKYGLLGQEASIDIHTGRILPSSS
ncbi:MAG: hypothetical protein ACE5IG_06115 [Dehalococcoidia bacterium]